VAGSGECGDEPLGSDATDLVSIKWGVLIVPVWLSLNPESYSVLFALKFDHRDRPPSLKCLLGFLSPSRQVSG
jgi:hypothetical protein